MELTLAELKEIFQEKVVNIFIPGECVFIRTVTYHLTGRVRRQIGSFVELEEAAWIADSGRFSDAISKGTLSEVEPVPGIVRVNIAAVTDIFQWTNPLPRARQ